MPPSSGPRGVKPTRVKVKKPSQSFTAPIGQNTIPGQAQAKAKVQRATKKVERNVVAPAIPKLKHPTSAQRGAAQSLVASSLHKQGITTTDQVKALPKAQRVRVNRAKGYATTNAKRANVAGALVRGVTGPYTEKELARIGRLADAQTRAQVLPGPAHKRVGIPGLATIDLTNAEHTLGQHLAGNPIAAIAHAVPKGLNIASAQKGAVGLVGRATRDAVDLPASTITSTYLVGKAAATGHEGKAFHMLYDPIKQTVEHPVKSFSQHPLNTVLIFRGIKGAVGHGAGRVMRSGAVGSTAKAAAGTERAPLVTENMKRGTNRQYNRDPSSKLVQVANERRLTRKAQRKGTEAPTVQTAAHIRHNAVEDAASAKLQSAHNAAEVEHKAAKALGYKRGKGPTAATNLVAQGVTNATRADLEKYLAEIKAKSHKLKGDRLARSQETQRLIVKALKNHDPEKVAGAARAYQQFVATELEPKALAAHLVEPKVAEETRLAGVRVRRVGRIPDEQVNGSATVRRMATQGEKVARLEADHAEAAFKQATADAKTAARVNGGRIPPPQHDALLRAIERNDKAVAKLERMKTAATQARITHTREHLLPGEEPAYVSQQPIPARTPALPAGRVLAKVKQQRTGKNIREGALDAHPMKLVEQAGQTQRLIDAAAARDRFAEDYGYRPEGKGIQPFKSGQEAKGFAQRNGLESTWVPFKRQDGTTVLVHKAARDTIEQIQKGTDVHPVVKNYTARWRRLVLAFSPRWLAGNIFEAAVRSVVSGSGPTSYAIAKRNIAALRKTDPAAAADLEARTLGGGNYTAAQRLARERVTVGEMNKFAKAVHKFGSAPGAHSLGQLYGAYTDLVFRQINGKLEGVFQTAMLGRAMRNHPVIGDRVVGLSAKAAQEAAQGLRDTATQAELGRAVDRMYGQYDKFSPGTRNAIANYTPFVAWTLNAVKFLTQVLPADHPVLTALLASANEATAQWRKDHGLFLDALGKTPAQLPGWLQGSVPGSAGSHLRLSRYTPFGLADNNTGILGGIAGNLLPQFSGIIENMGGKDWTGADLSKNPGFARAALAAGVTFIESQVPITQQLAGVTGAQLPNERDNTKHSAGVGTRVREQFDPMRFTPAKKPTGSSKDPLSVKYGLGAGSSVDDLAKKYGLGSGSNVDDLAKKYGLK